ncbi:lysophospholipid acyltransferase family protein [Rugosimonospora africana]|uniref:Phospholipid/glycerol acyltransferase domain-containing protein n=1 Tax=Rugosimonospora africana TaxID=556532 RepID=A0A8J3R6B5_9ACTN|nr:lysophospholipid acyltransferase family protein [Rugosimonospora africana]GIH20826.1 hypothetical protein Raf01_89980 [Rugosimonospora africana]
MTAPAGPDAVTVAPAGPLSTGPTGPDPVGAGRDSADGDSAGTPSCRPPRLWRALLVVARVLLAPFCRLRVTGPPLPTRLPALGNGKADRHGGGGDSRDGAEGDSRGGDGREAAAGTGSRPGGGPVILAANHIGSLDPIVLMAACRVRRIAPRIMATGGLFRIPVFGAVLRHCGLVRVDRYRAEVTAALPAARAVLDQGSVLLAYPEGRITLDPGAWPERGRTGLARLARDTGAPVVPVSQWGAHLLVPWGAPWGAVRRLLWALVHRPVVRVHFGAPVDLTGLRIPQATDRIMATITENLRALRPDEPRLPAWIDPVRPVSTARSRRHPPA